MTDKVVMYAGGRATDLDKTGATLLAVLCRSEHANSYVAYQGLVRLGMPTHRMYEKQLRIKADRVAAQGHKLAFGEAVAYFPAIKKGQYRDG